MRYRYVLFDLDGTLTDPKVGITKAAQYSLARFDIHEPNLDRLEHFIGPPLKETFKVRYGFSDEHVKMAIVHYREYFGGKGIYENMLYSGIENLLSSLKDHGKTLALATTKPTVYAERILHHYRIHRFFDVVSGGALDDSISDKDGIVREALVRIGNPIADEAVLAGDTHYDLVGAKQNGIHFIGVSYGYGFRESSSADGSERSQWLAIPRSSWGY